MHFFLVSSHLLHAVCHWSQCPWFGIIKSWSNLCSNSHLFLSDFSDNRPVRLLLDPVQPVENFGPGGERERGGVLQDESHGTVAEPCHRAQQELTSSKDLRDTGLERRQALIFWKQTTKRGMIRKCLSDAYLWREKTTVTITPVYCWGLSNRYQNIKVQSSFMIEIYT